MIFMSISFDDRLNMTGFQIRFEFKNYLIEIGKMKDNFWFEIKLTYLSCYILSRFSSKNFILISILNISYFLKSLITTFIHK